jgi:hypothetical protein
MKTIWLSAIEKDEAIVQKLMSQMKTYGLILQGHFWTNDNAKMAWLGPREELLDDQTGMWAILAGRDQLLQDDLRYGLSMLALALEARKKGGNSIVILQTEGDPVTADDLPTPLKRALVLPVADAGTPAKLVARVHAGTPSLSSAYVVDMVGNEQLGQWLEVRPTGDDWPGVIFGVNEGEILFQAVGPAGKLPKTSVLNYAMQGLKLEMGGTEFTAWAARNEISKENAYYVKISGTPKTLLFGPYAEDSEAELYVIMLQ